MVQFFNPPPSAFSGNLPFRPNPLASAIQVPAAIDRRARAMQELIASRNPAFASLPQDRQFASARNLVLGDPSVRKQAAGLRPTGVFNLLDDEGKPTGQIGHEVEPFGTALQNHRRELLGNEINGPQKPGDSAPLSPEQAGESLVRNVAGAASKTTAAVDDFGQDIVDFTVGAGNELLNSIPRGVLEAGEKLSNFGLSFLEGPPPKRPPDQVKRGLKSLGVKSIGSAILLTNIRNAVKNDPTLQGIDVSIPALKAQAKARKISLREYLKLIADGMGVSGAG